MIDDKLLLVNAKLTGVTCLLGWTNAAVHDSPPRLVWVPAGSGDTIVAPTMIGAGDYNAINDHWVTLEAQVWALTSEALRAIVHNLIVALREIVYGPQFKIGTIKWGRDAVSKLGLIAVVPVQIKIPVLDQYCDLPIADAVALQPDAATTVTIVVPSVTPVHPADGEAQTEVHSATLEPPAAP